MTEPIQPTSSGSESSTKTSSSLALSSSSLPTSKSTTSTDTKDTARVTPMPCQPQESSLSKTRSPVTVSVVAASSSSSNKAPTNTCTTGLTAYGNPDRETTTCTAACTSECNDIGTKNTVAGTTMPVKTTPMTTATEPTVKTTAPSRPLPSCSPPPCLPSPSSIVSAPVITSCSATTAPAITTGNAGTFGASKNDIATKDKTTCTNEIITTTTTTTTTTTANITMVVPKTSETEEEERKPETTTNTSTSTEIKNPDSKSSGNPKQSKTELQSSGVKSTSTKKLKPSKAEVRAKDKAKDKAKATRQKTAQNLSKEMQTYIYSNPRTTAYRAAHYRPSLETFQKVSFSHYVRYVLLGVDMETDSNGGKGRGKGRGRSKSKSRARGKSNVLLNDIDDDVKIELMNEEPYYSDDSDEDSEDNSNDNDNENNNDESKKAKNLNQTDYDVNEAQRVNDKTEDTMKEEVKLEKGIPVEDRTEDIKKGDPVVQLKHDNDGKMEIDSNSISVTNVDTSHQPQENDLDQDKEIQHQQDHQSHAVDTKAISDQLTTIPTTNVMSQTPPPSLLSSEIISVSKPEEKGGEEKIQTENETLTSLPQQKQEIPQSKSSSPPPLETTSRNNVTKRRMTTRSQTKSIPVPSSPGKENIYSKQYYVGPRIQRRQRRRRSQEQDNEQESTVEGGKSLQCTSKNKNEKKQSTAKKQQQQSSEPPSQPLLRSSPRTVSKPKPKPLTSRNVIKKLIPAEPKKLDLDSLKLSDGIGKITPPVGWWDYTGIGKDLSGRGKPWQPGTKLGDMVIPQPIKQCAYGIGGVYDFTMMELPSITVAEFRKEADGYRKRQLGSEYDDINDVEAMGDEKMDMLARKFWKRLGPTMESSKYGADMEGSLFNGDEACGWNVDQLDSCLQLLLADVNKKDLEELKNKKLTEEDFRMPGVNSAYLYFGMWASVFCAHTEDMNLLSINYLHAGAPKYWYAISPKDRGRFESLMASLFSHQSSSCKEFLRHKRSLVSPSILTKAGIEYTTQVQRAGDIMITYPGSYHFGFNTGFNVAESTNFAVPEWIPLGDEARVCMCHPHSVRIEMNRFKTLLSEYERDQLVNVQNGLPKVTYSQWARDNVKSKIRKRQRETQEDNEKPESSNKIQKTDRSTKKRGMVVEVMKLLVNDGVKSAATKHRTSSKKRKTASSKGKKKYEEDDYRIALKLKKSSLCQKKQTPVLCLLESGPEYHYFAGNVSAIVEDHARIHFVGTSKCDDLWIPTDSENLFLDGGRWEEHKSS
eukprot:CAMPEP_0203668398 /NCGR_PEP_ID=MMETSP0090-20130426/5032_1 /ASSEMBLY_ACC=CAM_ASM_001088 /TAXON_ID=426623 /ORGANISM="Chaetoceros affinis, Strain CCMP159" /LENGTH=1263 /DNA_ID=CAMNT_0050532819 /DNA_START=148 /DNA_END=3939 /DNA_ORIENTATION=+